MMNSNTREKELICFIILFVLLFTTVLFNTYDVFLHNVSSFEYVFKDFALPLFIIVVVLSLVGTIFFRLFLSNSILFSIFLDLCAGITLASYIQLCFLNKTLPSLDGTEINWNWFSGESIKSLLVWGISIAFAFIVGKIAQKNSNYLRIILPLLIFSMLATNIVIDLVNFSDSADTQTYCYDGAEQFVLGGEQNTVVLILDTLDNESFERYLESDESLQECLNDFTYFSNANSLGMPTYPSLINMLTGSLPDFNKDTASALEECWGGETVNTMYGLLKSAGFKVNYYGATYDIGDPKFAYGVFDNLYAVSHEDLTIKYQVMAVNLFTLDMYRLMPYPLKQYFWFRAYFQDDVVKFNKTGTNYNMNSDYYNALIENGITVKNDEKRVVYQYLSGIHKPYTTDENCQYNDNSSLEQSIKGCMKLLKEYILALKSAGIYDKTAIIIAADHGIETAPQPFLLIKQVNSNCNKMVVNDNPICYTNFAQTVCSCSGIDGYVSFFDESSYINTRYVIRREYDPSFHTVRNHYGTGVGEFNVWRKYIYNGNRDELKEALSNPEMAEVHMLVDSVE